MQESGDPREQAEGGYDWRALADGMRATLSLAGLVMACSFVGFGAFVRSLDLSLFTGLATNLLIWALPGQVVFVDMWQKQAGLLLIGIAVTLTAVRLFPMVLLVLSKARLPGQPRWPEFAVAHFTAVTIWIISNQRIEAVARQRRLPWLLGLGVTLMIGMFGFTSLGYWIADALPVTAAATLVMFTPAFFMLGLFGGARRRFDYLAIVLGGALGVTATLYFPAIDLLIAGIGGGTLAYVLARPGRREASK